MKNVKSREKIQTLNIPSIGEGIEEVKVVALLKRSGATFKSDEIIYEIESEKSLMEIEAPCSGRLLEWMVEEGQVAKVGAEIAIIEQKDQEDASEIDESSSENEEGNSEENMIDDILRELEK